MAVSFKGAHFPPEVILMGIRWYLAYPLSTRHVEELMEERGVNVGAPFRRIGRVFQVETEIARTSRTHPPYPCRMA